MQVILHAYGYGGKMKQCQTAQNNQEALTVITNVNVNLVNNMHVKIWQIYLN